MVGATKSDSSSERYQHSLRHFANEVAQQVWPEKKHWLNISTNTDRGLDEFVASALAPGGLEFDRTKSEAHELAYDYLKERSLAGGMTIDGILAAQIEATPKWSYAAEKYGVVANTIAQGTTVRCLEWTDFFSFD